MDSNIQIKELFKEKIIFGKYQITKNIEKNKNLQIYEGKNILSDELIIIKVEQKKDKKKKGLLEMESYFLNYLKSPGIPTIQEIGYYKNNIISIQALLGLTLSKLFIRNFGKFNIKDITLISIQILERIKYIHNKNIIHCDICPNNFVLGIGRFQNIIYMTNFNSAKRYKDKNTLEHIKYKLSNNFRGNYIFASVNALRGVELSRRDDLESLGYILIYFLKGGLPWEHIKSLSNSEKIRKIYQIKKNYNLSILCAGIPEEFKLFLNYVKSLTFQEEPDYNYCFSLFYGIFKKMKILNDGIFSWYQEKKKENQNLIKKFYNKLWFNKYFNNNTSTTSLFHKRESIKNHKIKKSNSCFLYTHNLTNYILNIHDNLSKIINNENKINYLPINKNLEIKNINGQQSIKVDLAKHNIYKKNLKENNNNISTSSEKEYSIEGKIEQESEKIKTYEKKQIGINIKKSFNKQKKEDNKKTEIQNELTLIKKRITNKKQKEEKDSLNNKYDSYFNSINKTSSNKDINSKNFHFQTERLQTDFLKKSIPFIKSDNSSTKNYYFKNRIKYFRKIDTKDKNKLDFTSNSQLKSRMNTSRVNNFDISNNDYNTIANTNNNIKDNLNLYEKDNSKKKQKKIISLNFENLILNSNHCGNISTKSFIKHSNENKIKKNKKIGNSYQNSLNDLSNKENDTIIPGKIKVVKKKMIKIIKTDNNISNIRPKKINIYEHKSLLNKTLKTQTYKKYSGVLNNVSNKNLYNNNINDKKFNKKITEKIFKKMPLYQSKICNLSQKGFTISTNRDTERNKRICSSIPSSIGKKTKDFSENESNNNVFKKNNTEQSTYNTQKNNNTIFSNFNKIKNKNYIYAKNNEIKNKNYKTLKKSKEVTKKLVKISNSPIIHNSISKLNLIQNVSNIYVTKSYLEEKPLTERKNKGLTSKMDQNKNIYIKPKNKISYDLALLNKENINNILLELNNKNKSGGNYVVKKGEDNSQNYYFSEFNIFKEK